MWRPFFVILTLIAMLGATMYWRDHFAPQPPPPPPVPVAAPQPPPVPALPALPEVHVEAVPIHPVPGEAGDVADEPEQGVSAEVANGPSRLPAAVAPKRFSGLVSLSGGTALQVGPVPVQLFGIKSPGPGDRCGFGAASDCVSAAHRALVTKLAPGSQVTCQIPTPHPGMVVAFAICLDSDGADLGGFLVSEGLALADTGQSYDYAGAETLARSQKRGLWNYR